MKRKLESSSSPLDKYCVLCMDEAIKANLCYNISQDEVIGFEDMGDDKSFFPACNVAVLMIREFCYNYTKTSVEEKSKSKREETRKIDCLGVISV